MAMRELQTNDGKGKRLRHSGWRPSLIAKPRKHNPWVVWDSKRNYITGKRIILYRRKWTENYKVNVFNRNSNIWKDFYGDRDRAMEFFREANEKILFDGKLYDSRKKLMLEFNEKYRIKKVFVTDEQIERLLRKEISALGLSRETGFAQLSIILFLKKKGIFHKGNNRYGRWVRK